MSKYTVKRNNFTQLDEVNINKRTRLEQPSTSEVNFDISQQDDQEQAPVKNCC